MDAGTLCDLADALAGAQSGARLIEPISARRPDFGIDAAQAVQHEITRRRLAAGWRIVGRKIGFTNRSIWPLYDVDAPMWAPVFERTVTGAANGHARVSLAGLVQPRIEPEIALGLGSDVPPGLGSPQEVLERVRWYAHSIEIVDCHFPDWKARLPDFCADNACHARLVLGRPHPVDAAAIALLARQLRDCRVELLRSGRRTLEGRGANALDHPALALAHLAALVARDPQAPPLAAGEMVSTGTLTDALPVRAGETWSTRFEGIDLEGIEIEFSA
ncbi:MAG: fumarylacetoacetate hydrolase family protein [Burkholderiales bacterium]|nr:fumarylacetoacetate hydrolase family protein [Burkholderiales bacterium]